MIKIYKLTFQIFLIAILTVKGQMILPATGSSNVFNVNYPANFGTSIPQGTMFTFKSNQDITGQAYLNLNGVTTDEIVKNVNLSLVSNDIRTGHFVSVIYDGSNWQMLSTNANTPPYPWGSLGNNSFNTNTSNVGINTSTPGSTLEVRGSVAVSGIITTTSGGAFGPRDFMINYTGTASVTITLPNPVTCKGRICIIKASSALAIFTVTVNATGGANVEAGASYAISVSLARRAVTFISDGTAWWITGIQ